MTKMLPAHESSTGKFRCASAFVSLALAALSGCSETIGEAEEQPPNSSAGMSAMGGQGAPPGGATGTSAGTSAGGSGAGATTTPPGSAGTVSAGSGSGGTATPPSPVEPTATPALARLSLRQWANTVRALLKDPTLTDLEADITKDAVPRFDNEANALFVGEALRVDLQTEAERLAAKVTADPAAVTRLMPANAPSEVMARARAFIEHFGKRAYRRPLTTEEIQQHVSLFNQGPQLVPGTPAFEAGMRVVIEVMLQSPHFIYRTLLGGPQTDRFARLSGYEVASALSYGLTNTMPDDALFAAAADGSLNTSAGVEAQARRLLATDAAKEAVDHFNFQAYGFGAFSTVAKDTATAAEFTQATAAAVGEEARRFSRWVFEQNGGVAELLTSPVTFVTAATAPVYGLQGTFDNTFKQVTLDPNQRPGLLTRLGFLAFYGHQALQDSIRRGVYVNHRILCREIAAPDATIPPLPPSSTAKTNRELVNSFTGPGTCGASCHGTIINPAGFAFENFDGVGRYRTTENGEPVDAASTLAFNDGAKSFTNIAEFTRTLAESPDVHACFAKTWFRNVYARQVSPAEEPMIEALARRSLQEKLQIREIIVALVANEAFATRVAEVTP